MADHTDSDCVMDLPLVGSPCPCFAYLRAKPRPAAAVFRVFKELPLTFIPARSLGAAA